MRAGRDSPFPRRPSISDATPDWMRRRPKRPKHKCVNGVKKVAYRFRTLRRSKRVRTKLIRRRVSKRVNQWTERETRCEIKTKSWSVNGWCHPSKSIKPVTASYEDPTSRLEHHLAARTADHAVVGSVCSVGRAEPGIATQVVGRALDCGSDATRRKCRDHLAHRISWRCCRAAIGCAGV